MASSSSTATPTIKIHLLGSPHTGKTTLIRHLVAHLFTAEYVPTMEHIYTHPTSIPTQNLLLTLYDLGGNPDFDRYRSLFLQSGNVLLICFDTSDYDTFADIETRWIPIAEAWVHEKREGNHKAFVGLVGCKTDLRQHDQLQAHETRKSRRSMAINKSDVSNGMVSSKEATELIEKYSGIFGYFECSALRGEGVERVFEETVKVFLGITATEQMELKKMKGRGEKNKCLQM
ncbi:hypothetical protein RUND412_001093 [Rhizina undulata]